MIPNYKLVNSTRTTVKSIWRSTVIVRPVVRVKTTSTLVFGRTRTPLIFSLLP